MSAILVFMGKEALVSRHTYSIHHGLIQVKLLSVGMLNFRQGSMRLIRQLTQIAFGDLMDDNIRLFLFNERPIDVE